MASSFLYTYVQCMPTTNDTPVALTGGEEDSENWREERGREGDRRGRGDQY